PTSFATSVGFSVKGGGQGKDDANDGGPPGGISDVRWDGPAFKAGVTPDMRLIGVNDQAFSIAHLREAIVAAENNKEPIKLLLKREKEFITIALDYHGGLRYPHLERVQTTPDRLDTILAP